LAELLIGRRVGGPAQLLQDDRRLDGVGRVCQFGPPEVGVDAPQRSRVGAVVGDGTHQRRRNLLDDGLVHRVLPQPLLGVELKQHRTPSS
jgi:hypothetical protein